MRIDGSRGRPRVGEPVQVGPFRVRRVEYPAGLRQPSHRHDRASVTVVLRGAIRETTARGEEEGGPLSVVAKPAGVRHADEFGPHGALTVQVVIDSDRWSAPAENGLAVDRWRWLHAGPTTGPLVALARAALRTPLPTAEMEDVVLEALVALGRDRGGEASSPPGWLESVKEALDDDPFANRSVRELARLAGVHPATVSRMFRRHYRLTITEYRQRRRLRRAARLAAEASGTLSRVAHAAGYADHPHMCRDFRRLVGVSPSTYRSLASTP